MTDNQPSKRTSGAPKSSMSPLYMLAVAAGTAIAGTLVWLAIRAPAEAPAPSASAAASASAPTVERFARFELPPDKKDKVKIRQVGEGFEVINTDPALTGQDISFAGVTPDGGTIIYNLKIPPPPGQSEFGR